MPLTKITGEEFDNTQGGLIVAGIITAASFYGSLTGNVNSTGVSTFTSLNVTGIGNTQSVWFDTLDSKSLSANNVSLLVQPENAYFHNSSLSSRNYYPVVVSTALTTNNVSNFGALYGITNLANVAGTASTARVYGVGSYNFLARNSTTDVSSFTNNQLLGQLNNVVQGTNVDASVVTGSAINSTNQTIIQKGTATNIIGNYQVISVGNVPNNSANSTSAFNFNAFSVAGASSGTGIGTITDLYSYYANALILSTGRVSNYYGLYLNSPSVFGSGTLSNRYSIFSNDASSPMYHAGSIGLGLTNPSEKLDVSGNIKLSSPGFSILNSSGRKILNQTGSILQVVHTEYTTATALGCAALTDVSGFSAAITPSSTSSKVLVMVHFSGILDCDGRLNLKVGGSVVKSNLVGTDRPQNANGSAGVNNYYDAGTYCATYLHSPASTSALTYQIAVQCGGCSQTAYFNRDPSNSADNGRSGITLMEISG
jgi:hypothetical protein